MNTNGSDPFLKGRSHHIVLDAGLMTTLP